jgi:hypothetical protein
MGIDWSANRSLFGSRSRHCYAIKWLPVLRSLPLKKNKNKKASWGVGMSVRVRSRPRAGQLGPERLLEHLCRALCRNPILPIHIGGSHRVASQWRWHTKIHSKAAQLQPIDLMLTSSVSTYVGREDLKCNLIS